MGTVLDSFRIRGVRTCCHEFKQTKDYSIIDLSHNGYVFTDDQYSTDVVLLGSKVTFI